MTGSFTHILRCQANYFTTAWSDQSLVASSWHQTDRDVFVYVSGMNPLHEAVCSTWQELNTFKWNSTFRQLTKFGWVPFSDLLCARLAVEHTIQNSHKVLFLAIYGPKFTKFWHNVGNFSRFPRLFSGCLCRVSFRRHSSLSWNRQNDKSRQSSWQIILSLIAGISKVYPRYFPLKGSSKGFWKVL